ncbi:hypothetical protein DLM76_03295 [Leptospira yasudae]|uniref:hypothetical protein n=1 Tax=Leptospira yasudae TaxID=2202201 RepID=UPI000E59A996|nr:hypothetical protein [Leptospira yasudae]RHX95999.1 hypothetical protein DLM76_03295 [Leptospira yasudae]
MIFRCFQLFVEFAYPSSYSKTYKNAILSGLEDSYTEGKFRIFDLFDILLSGFRERIASEQKVFSLVWRHNRSTAFGIFILIPWDLFLLSIFASFFVGGEGWLKFFHNFPYERNKSAEFFLPFLLFVAGFLLVRDLFFSKKKRTVLNRYSYWLYLNYGLIVPFFLILIL